MKTRWWQWVQGCMRGALSQRLVATETRPLLQMLNVVSARAQQPRRTSRKLSGIQSSRRSGTPSMSVIQSADVTEPRMATTTLLLS